MTERKKPGPKPKCKECGRPEGQGHYDDCPVGLGVIRTPEDAAALKVAVGNLAADIEADVALICKAQAYAQRVWDGQSVDVPRAEKLRRVALALEGQGLSMEGVSL